MNKKTFTDFQMLFIVATGVIVILTTLIVVRLAGAVNVSASVNDSGLLNWTNPIYEQRLNRTENITTINSSREDAYVAKIGNKYAVPYDVDVNQTYRVRKIDNLRRVNIKFRSNNLRTDPPLKIQLHKNTRTNIQLPRISRILQHNTNKQNTTNHTTTTRKKRHKRILPRNKPVHNTTTILLRRKPNVLVMATRNKKLENNRRNKPI